QQRHDETAVPARGADHQDGLARLEAPLIQDGQRGHAGARQRGRRHGAQLRRPGRQVGSGVEVAYSAKAPEVTAGIPTPDANDGGAFFSNASATTENPS